MVPVGINVVGYVSGNLGLGVLARDLVRLLIARGHPVAIFDLDAGGGRSGLETPPDVPLVGSIDDLPHPITIWVFGADFLAIRALEILDSPRLRKQTNVAYVWWELPDVPALWQLASEAFDALLVGSEFVREAWAMQVRKVPVILAPVPIQLPSNVRPERSRFGLSEKRFLVYTGFEPASDPTRKNPFAAVAAFKSAFADTDTAGLVIKLNNSKADSRASAQVELLRHQIAADPRITLVEERLPYEVLMSLYASCDAAISLHRSEGLGLMPMEMMAVGRPVVATGWSGNMTYMDHANACLVRYDMVPVDQSSIHYAPRVTGIASRWADPDVGHAAQWLRRLHDDVEFRRALGEMAARDIVVRNSRGASARFVDELTGMMQCRPEPDTASRSRLRQDIAVQLVAARRRLQSQGLTPTQRASRAVRAVFDRHIGWRLKSGDFVHDDDGHRSHS